MKEEKMTWFKFHSVSTERALDIYQLITGCNNYELNKVADEMATQITKTYPNETLENRAAVSVQTALNMVLLELKNRRVERPKVYRKWVV